MPRLSVNVISKGKYWKAGEEIPDEELSPNLLKYVARHNGYAEEIRQQRNDADGVEWKPQAKLSSKRYVKRGEAFKRVDSVETIRAKRCTKTDLNSPTFQDMVDTEKCKHENILQTSELLRRFESKTHQTKWTLWLVRVVSEEGRPFQYPYWFVIIRNFNLEKDKASGATSIGVWRFGHEDRLLPSSKNWNPLSSVCQKGTNGGSISRPGAGQTPRNYAPSWADYLKIHKRIPATCIKIGL